MCNWIVLIGCMRVPVYVWQLNIIYDVTYTYLYSLLKHQVSNVCTMNSPTTTMTLTIWHFYYYTENAQWFFSTCTYTYVCVDPFFLFLLCFFYVVVAVVWFETHKSVINVNIIIKCEQYSNESPIIIITLFSTFLPVVCLYNIDAAAAGGGIFFFLKSSNILRTYIEYSTLFVRSFVH